VQVQVQVQVAVEDAALQLVRVHIVVRGRLLSRRPNEVT
jgi:hypothetical protein